LGEIIPFKKEKIVVTQEEFEEYHRLLIKIKETNSLIELLNCRRKIRKLIKIAKKREQKSKNNH
jgi:hypothetical protein